MQKYKASDTRGSVTPVASSSLDCVLSTSGLIAWVVPPSMPGCPASDRPLGSVLDISFHRIKALAAMFLPLISRAAERLRPPRDPKGGEEKRSQGERGREVGVKRVRGVYHGGEVLGLGEMRDRLRARGRMQQG